MDASGGDREGIVPGTEAAWKEKCLQRIDMNLYFI